MRLLPKSEIDKVKALDRQREIEEGKKLATRVDGLRELASIEETKLTAFRTKAVKETREAIDGVLAEKEALLSQISGLRHERELLQIPLDLKWDEVNKEKEHCVAWQYRLEEREDIIDGRTERLRRLERELEIEKERSIEERIRSGELVVSSSRMYEEAKEELAKARDEAQIIISQIEFKMLEMRLREERVAARERDLKNNWAQIDRANKLNSEEAERLADQRKTLERAMKRIK